MTSFVNELEFVRLTPDASPPERAYGESAAWDLYCYYRGEGGRFHTHTIAPGSTRVIGTGLALRPPSGSVILICSRSGFATRGVFVANAPGVVDPDYIGEIKVILFNGGMEPHYVRHGDRIAQALIVPLTVCKLIERPALPPTERGERGFGSTGA